MADDKAVKEDVSWVDDVQISGRGDFYYMSKENLEKRARKLGKTVVRHHGNGQFKVGVHKAVSVLNERGLTTSKVSHNFFYSKNPDIECIGEDFVCRFSNNGEAAIDTYSEERADKFLEAVEIIMKPVSTVLGRVYMLAQQYGGGLAFETIGVAGAPIVRTNYSEKTLEAYDHFVEELDTDDPCGRLCVLTGPTGTGKTHLIKGMINSDAANFAFIPPQMVSSISGPSIIKAVKDFSNSNPGKPLVFVLEDADECLMPRGSDNISSISSILNASEGILGQLMNIRIIATTNADIKKLDSAITRDGRLCARAEVGKLTPEHATRVLCGLLDSKEEVLRETYTLAEVYKMARQMGWSGKGGKSVKPIDNKQIGANLGFTMPSTPRLKD
jgi:hypothetical protein